jgi:hypothetical protein
MKICPTCGTPEHIDDDVTYTSAEVREIIEQMASAYKRYVNKRIADHVATEQKARAAAEHEKESVTKPLYMDANTAHIYTAPPQNPAEKT